MFKGLRKGHFGANLDRIMTFAMMPANISLIARRETLWLANARHRAGEAELTLDDLVAQGFVPTEAMEKEVANQV